MILTRNPTTLKFLIAACYISPDEMWLFYLLARTFEQSQTLWLHLATNSKSATRRPFVVQQINPGNGFTTFIVTPVSGVEKVRMQQF